MSDPVSLARTARENLARGLGALQSPGVPQQVMAVAEPIATAMSALHRVEASHGAARGEAAPAALQAARHALGMLQQQPVLPGQCGPSSCRRQNAGCELSSSSGAPGLVPSGTQTWIAWFGSENARWSSS